MTPAWIALGSNLGDRHHTLQAALGLLKLQPGIYVEQVSTLRETEPVGGPADQGPYLNGVVRLATTLTPRQLLSALHAIENQLGRVRTEPWGPRTLDLDLLLYADAVIHEHDLVVPHPRLQERIFVLEPMVEINPVIVHPILRSTMSDLLKKLQTRDETATLSLAGKTALVTGSTSGIGRAIAVEYARAGARVVVHGRRSRDAAELVARDCDKVGVPPRVVMADLGDAAERARLVEEAVKLGVDICVNNAGVDTLTGEAAAWSFERKLAELWRVDVVGTIELSRALGQRFLAKGQGVIINMGWDQAQTGMAGDSGELFATVKGAIMAFSKSLALSLAPQVRVNCLAPGWIRTAWGHRASVPWQERVLRETPLGRWGEPKDVAQAALWLAAGVYITGQTICVNGGAVR